MASAIFRRDLKEATGTGWEEWIARLDRSADPIWSHERLKDHLCEEYGLSDEWTEWIAVLYGQRLGRVPVGVTRDAGVQIGVRRTWAASREKLWKYLLSPRGLRHWIGDVPEFRLEKGFEFASREGVTGKLTVVQPLRKLRMNWKRRELDRSSRLQIYLLEAGEGKTTAAVHQEMLEDVYIRELMRRFWEERLGRMRAETEGKP